MPRHYPNTAPRSSVTVAPPMQTVGIDNQTSVHRVNSKNKNHESHLHLHKRRPVHHWKKRKTGTGNHQTNSQP